MSAKGKRRGTHAYSMGFTAFDEDKDLSANCYQYGDNYLAWQEGWADAKAEYDRQQARDPDDRMREFLMTIRTVDGTVQEAIADAIEMIWEKVR